MLYIFIQLLRAIIVKSNFAENPMIELILELKQKCNFDSEIGSSLNLKEKEIAFLSAIANDENITSKNLAEITGLSPSRSSRIISALHEKGYVEMKHNPLDRRLINLTLTEKGISCANGITKEKNQCETELLSGLSETEKETVRKGLKILLEKL